MEALRTPALRQLRGGHFFLAREIASPDLPLLVDVV
jgi:hypothetical protein